MWQPAALRKPVFNSTAARFDMTGGNYSVPSSNLGPGAYQILDYKQDRESFRNPDYEELFGSYVPRFTQHPTEMKELHPGATVNKSCLAELEERQMSVLQSGFGSNADRFARTGFQPLEIGVPGPGSYNLPREFDFDEDVAKVHTTLIKRAQGICDSEDEALYASVDTDGKNDENRGGNDEEVGYYHSDDDRSSNEDEEDDEDIYLHGADFSTRAYMKLAKKTNHLTPHEMRQVVREAVKIHRPINPRTNIPIVGKAKAGGIRDESSGNSAFSKKQRRPQSAASRMNHSASRKSRSRPPSAHVQRSARSGGAKAHDCRAACRPSRPRSAKARHWRRLEQKSKNISQEQPHSARSAPRKPGRQVSWNNQGKKKGKDRSARRRRPYSARPYSRRSCPTPFQPDANKPSSFFQSKKERFKADVLIGRDETIPGPGKYDANFSQVYLPLKAITSSFQPHSKGRFHKYYPTPHNNNGAHLGPGSYDHVNPIDDFLNKGPNRKTSSFASKVSRFHNRKERKKVTVEDYWNYLAA